MKYAKDIEIIASEVHNKNRELGIADGQVGTQDTEVEKQDCAVVDKDFEMLTKTLM